MEKPPLSHIVFRFVRGHALWILLLSALALIPCFWHPEIEAGDLASHTYNAWLTSLVHQGAAPGLWIGRQTNNILFDILLLRLGSIFGFSAGEKVVVCFAVLVFLWGSFSLASAVIARPAWFLLPLLLVLTYGWTFEMGFFNFYLSLGLACFGLALVWLGGKTNYLYATLVAILVWLAHPLGAVWFVGTALYIQAAKYLKPPAQWGLVPLALLVLFVIRLYLAADYRVLWPNQHFYNLNGSDQLLLGSRYSFLPLCLILAVAGALLLHAAKFRGGTIASYFPVPLQLFVVAFLGISLLPDSIWMPRYAEPVSLISSRFTLAVGVLGCCALANLRPQLFLAVLTGAVALIYFSFLYRDTGRTYLMEQQARVLVNEMPKDASSYCHDFSVSQLPNFCTSCGRPRLHWTLFRCR